MLRDKTCVRHGEGTRLLHYVALSEMIIWMISLLFRVGEVAALIAHRCGLLHEWILFLGIGI